MKDLTISIVNASNKELLRDCLESIYKNTKKISFEVYVIDNALVDGSVEMVKNNFPNVNLIINKEPKGFNENHNQVLRIFNSRYFLLLNEDTLILENALDRMVEFMDNDKKIGALGCKLLNPDGSLQLSCRTFPNLKTSFFQFTYLYKIFKKSKIFGSYLMSYWNHNNIREVDQVMGACLMLRKETIEQVGLLDEQFFVFFDEVDYCFRIKKSGWKIVFYPDAKIIHYVSQSFKKWEESKVFYQYHLSMYKFFKKHYGKKKLFFLKFLVIFGLLLRTIGWLFIYLFSPNNRKRAKDLIKGYYEVIKIKI